MTTINATLYKTDGSKEPLILTRRNRLEDLQKMVGGYIEVIRITPFIEEIKGDFKNSNDLVINEEGKLLDLPINPWSQLVALNSIWENEEFRGDIILIEGRLP